MNLSDLPGADRIERGLAEARSGTLGVDGLLVAIGAPRLARAGIAVPEGARDVRDAELRLYTLLGGEPSGDAYARYNALLRELVSFERAAEHRARRLRGR